MTSLNELYSIISSGLIFCYGRQLWSSIEQEFDFLLYCFISLSFMWIQVV